MSDVTQVLAAVERGEPQALQQLFPLVYDELRKLAAVKLAHEKAGQTLQPTALVHEAYLRLVPKPGPESRAPDAQVEPASSGLAADRPYSSAPAFDSRGHFFAAAAEAMRRILVERARARTAQKRQGSAQQIDLDQIDLSANERSAELLALDEALSLLGQHDPQAARLVTLRYFAGLSHQEAAAVLGISRRAADRLWALAKAWLYRQLHDV